MPIHQLLVLVVLLLFGLVELVLELELGLQLGDPSVEVVDLHLLLLVGLSKLLLDLADFFVFELQSDVLLLLALEFNHFESFVLLSKLLPQKVDLVSEFLTHHVFLLLKP